MIKEPYVSLKEIIVDNPGVSNIDESSLLAGVVNAPCGPDHMLVQGPKQFLKYFTVGNAIPRDADNTLINAYFCSFFAPILVKRVWNATDGKVPVQTWSYGDEEFNVLSVEVDSLPNTAINDTTAGVTGDISLKYPVDLTGSEYVDLLAPEFDKTVAYSIGDIVYHSEDYYVANAATTQGADWNPSQWDEVAEFSATDSYSAGDVVLHSDHLYTANGSVSAGDWNDNDWASADVPTTIPTPIGATQWVVGITTPTVWDEGTSSTTKSAVDFGATPYGFLPDELEGNDLYVIYWYDAALGASAMTDESAGYLLVSTSKTGINPLTERGVYFEDVLDTAEVPFNVNANTFSAEKGLYKEAKFGLGGIDTDYNRSNSVTSDDYKLAWPWFEENSDVYNISYVSAFGKDGYEKLISADCQLENTRWFYFCDVPVASSNKVTDVTTWVNGLSLGDTYRTAIVGSFDKNPSVTGWVAPIAISSLILQKLYSNKASNSEFAPLFDATNGTLSVVKPYKEFTKSDREKLLSNTYPINWVKYDRTNNVYYMNDNRTHTRKQNVMNEEMNVRMVNKIQRDVMLLVQRYKGMLNTVETRLDVVRVITDYMDRYIMTQNYRPVEYRLVCDETNNTADIINANKLAIELDVRIQGSIKFINILNKVFPLGVAFEE